MKTEKKKTARRARRGLKMKKDQQDEKARVSISKKKALKLGKRLKEKVDKKKEKDKYLGDRDAPPAQAADLEFKI